MKKVSIELMPSFSCKKGFETFYRSHLKNKEYLRHNNIIVAALLDDISQTKLLDKL